MNLFWWRKKKEIQRSSKKGEDLTDDERLLIIKTKRCPDCGGKLKEGPQGGNATNYCCVKCFSEFNLIFIGKVIFGERISDAGPRDIGERAWCYGINIL